jgi:hypothetical protein
MRLTRRHLLALPAVLGLGTAVEPIAANPRPPIGLIFVGASWCPVCHQAAAVLAPATERSGLDILVASQNGKAIAPWTSFLDARGNRITASITEIPTLLFVDTARGQIIGALKGFQSPGQYLGTIRETLRQASAAHG